MTRTLWILALVASTCIGCAGPFGGGPGEDCDTCSVSETVGPTEAGAQAVSAPKGGQDVSNAPFSKDTARIQPRTQVTRGAGNISSTSADSEEREVASGGAQAIALTADTESEATASGGAGGGTALAILSEFRADMAAMRADMAVVRSTLEMTPAERATEIASIRADMATARNDLALALSHVGARTTTNNMGGDNTLIGVSSSSTDGRPPADSVKAAVEKGSAVATARKDAKAKPDLPEKAPSVPLDGE